MLRGMNFYNDRINKEVDMDGAYGAQCWDLFAYFCKKNNVPVINCTSSGYVKDIWNDRNKNGILNKFTIEPVMKCGDWAVFGETKETPYSHIAMFIEDINGNYGKFLGQNQNGIGKATVSTFSYASILGAFRLKDDKYTPSIPKRGKVTALYDNINVRSKPKVDNSTLTGYTYNQGMDLYYNGIVLADGWYWLTYVSLNTDQIRYIAYASEDGKKVYWK